MQRTDQHVLAPGTPIRSADRRSQGSIVGLLGQGGQGTVYKVQYSNRALALKWYHVPYLQADPMLLKRLTKAIDRGAPDQRFLWPLELVYIDGHASFGYLMPLRSEACVGMSALLAPPAERVVLPLKKRIAVCLNIARSFYALHARGFCYQDVNFGNIFLYEHTGEVLICDNDNVNIDGADASIYGTKKFMAPEVVRRESLPNTRTDLYSMAVMFHYVIMGWHPLEGAREHAINLLSAAEEMQIYGTQPLFLFNRDDSSNGPVLPYHSAIVKRWQALSDDFRDLFHRSFEKGLTDPHQRVVESEWIALLQSLENAVFACSHCQFEHIVDVNAHRQAQTMRCVHCDALMRKPAVLKIGRRVCVLEDDCVVPKSMADSESTRSWQSLAIVNSHPHRADANGLRNLSELDWRATAPDETKVAVKPGESVQIMNGLRIDCGNCIGQIIDWSSP